MAAGGVSLATGWVTLTRTKHIGIKRIGLVFGASFLAGLGVNLLGFGLCTAQWRDQVLKGEIRISARERALEQLRLNPALGMPSMSGLPPASPPLPPAPLPTALPPSGQPPVTSSQGAQPGFPAQPSPHQLPHAHPISLPPGHPNLHTSSGPNPGFVVPLSQRSIPLPPHLQRQVLEAQMLVQQANTHAQPASTSPPAPTTPAFVPPARTLPLPAHLQPRAPVVAPAAPIQAARMEIPPTPEPSKTTVVNSDASALPPPAPSPPSEAVATSPKQTEGTPPH